ncbi:DUF6881 domain-containing protein [Streptomyces odonnellii]|uniref:DUF6881 domain-containing protein n=1 Tax=Streptomyces odonnellii TaxID=1417980 RepID=UPI0038CD2FDA
MPNCCSRSPRSGRNTRRRQSLRTPRSTSGTRSSTRCWCRPRRTNGLPTTDAQVILSSYSSDGDGISELEVRHVKVTWEHDIADYPVLYPSGLGSDGYETRMVQFYRRRPVRVGL